MSLVAIQLHYFCLDAVIIAFMLYRFEVSPRTASIAIIAGLIISLVFRESLVAKVAVSVFGYMPETVVIYALAYLARGFGHRLVRWPKADLAVAIAFILAVFLSATGVVPLNLYDFGFEAGPAMMLAVVLAILAWWRRHMLFAVSVVVAQLAWLAGIGSSNFIDHIVHVVLLIPLVGMFVLGESNQDERIV